MRVLDEALKIVLRPLRESVLAGSVTKTWERVEWSYVRLLVVLL